VRDSVCLLNLSVQAADSEGREYDFRTSNKRSFHQKPEGKEPTTEAKVGSEMLGEFEVNPQSLWSPCRGSCPWVGSGCSTSSLSRSSVPSSAAEEVCNSRTLNALPGTAWNLRGTEACCHGLSHPAETPEKSPLDASWSQAGNANAVGWAEVCRHAGALSRDCCAALGALTSAARLPTCATQR